MGTWGFGPFESDTAARWAAVFDDAAPPARRSLLIETFARARRGDVLDNHAAESIVAAAAVVAYASAGVPPDGGSAPRSLAGGVGFEIPDALRATATDALHRVLDTGSEWSRLRAGSDGYAAAVAVIDGLLAKLAAPANQDWAPYQDLEEAAAVYLRDHAIGLAAVRAVVDLRALHGFTLECDQRDDGLYQEIAALDDTRLIIWIGTDEPVDGEPGAMLFASELRVVPLSSIVNVALEINYREEPGGRELGGVALTLHTSMPDYTKAITPERTEIYRENLYFSKSRTDGGRAQAERLAQFGRLVATRVR